MPTRHAGATWEGGLKSGRGSFVGDSGAISGSYTFGSRFEEATGSNPEELLAAALAACFSMALSGNLEKAGHPPRKVDTRAACTIEKAAAGMTVTRIALQVRGDVPGIDQPTLQQLAEQTSETCPVSRAVKGNVAIEVSTTLL